MLTDERKAALALARAAELRKRQTTGLSTVDLKLPTALAKVVKNMPQTTLQDLISRFVVAELKAKASVPSRAAKATQDTLDLIAKSAVKPAPVNPLAKGQEAIAKRNAATAAVIAKPGPAAGAVGVHEAVGAGARHAHNIQMQALAKRARLDHGVERADDGLAAATAAMAKRYDDPAMRNFIAKTATNADGVDSPPNGSTATTSRSRMAGTDASRQTAKPATSGLNASNFFPVVDLPNFDDRSSIEHLGHHGVSVGIHEGVMSITRDKVPAATALLARGGSKT